MCIVELPRLNGYGLEVDPIVITLEKGESVVRWVKIIIREVEKRSKPYWFSKTNKRQEDIVNVLKTKGIIKTWPRLMLEVKRDSCIKISLKHWLHKHKRPDPEKALNFFSGIINDVKESMHEVVISPDAVMLTTEIDSPAGPEEIPLIIRQLTREIFTNESNPQDEATPIEVQRIVRQLAIEAWQPKNN
jgi:hypothetical protein